MKKYKITYARYHESFGGHDHRDGEEVFYVQARNYESARNKAEKAIEKKTSGYIQSCWGRIREINEI